uniref:Granule-bound starch synthase 1, chloroplastic/amyloplastic n=1 Tax=Guillardia theta TaxID=55529 RepID=Q5K2R5_GUITH|nr:UDP-glucose-glycogen glucosyltransferase precursor [Guillardia theta]
MRRSVLSAAAVLSLSLSLLSLTPSNASTGVSSFSSSHRIPSLTRSALRLSKEGKGEDDKYGDPEAYVPQGGSKVTRNFMTCEDLRMSLRGGAGSDAIVPDQKLQIVFVSAEIAPWSVTGGLGAVCDGLPRALAKLGHRVMSIAPRYDQYYDAWDTEFTAEVPLGDTTTTVRFFHAFKKGVDRVFVDHPLFLEKVWGLSKQKLYGPKWGKDYEDNQLRFAMFCAAAMAATEKLSLGGYPYGQDVIFVANDWHAALVPMYLKKAQKEGTGWFKAKSACLLHNMVFQGRFPYDPNAASRLRLPQAMVDEMVTKQPLKVGRQKKASKGLKESVEIPNPPMDVLNFLTGAIKFSDAVLTVSPQYAKEVASSSAKGAELEKILTKTGIKGILNGVEDIVNPSNAELGLDIMYDGASLEKKAQGKTAMQKSLGFAVDENIPMFVFMGRLDAQKGVDIMFEAIDSALKGGMNAQFVTMGSGIEELEEVAAELEERYPNNFKAVLSFKGQEKYKTYAAADFAIMPSRYEPCGLVQMEGMRFGTLPIVCPTGGLLDTVSDMETGLVMEHEVDQDDITPADVEMLVKNFNRAISLYGNKDKYKQMQVNAMAAAKDYSWTRAAKQYVNTFLEIGGPNQLNMKDWFDII